MAFDQSMFASVGAHSSDTPNLYSYKSTDRLAEILLAGYFTAKSSQLEEGDFMLIQASDQSAFCEVDSTRSGVFEVAKPDMKTAFGELLVAENTPVLQVSAQYGLTDEMLLITSDGGSTNPNGGLFSAVSGTNALGLSSINTNRQLAYKAGQGALARLTAVFSAGQPNSLQAAGLINSEDGFAFGYFGEEFGIIYSSGGEVEYQELTVTTPAAGAETATITIDGTGYSVPLTAGTVQFNAIEIATSLNAQLTNFLVTANNDTVSVMKQIPGPNGAYSFSSTGAAVASFNQVTAGVEPTIQLIAQADWNQDTATWLDPQKGNVYFIDISYLGFGDLFFYVEDPESGRPLLVHIIKYANSSTSPSVGNPTFRIGWLARNLGNTTSLTVSGASCAGFIGGKLVRDSLPRGRSQQIVSAGVTQTNLITIRNRFNFGGRINRAEIIPLLLSLGTESAKGALFRLTANATFGTDAVFQYEDKNNSIVEYMDDPVTFTGGRILAEFYVSAGGLVINSDQFKSVILPDDQLTLSAAVVATPTALVVGSAVFQEDI